MERARSMKFPPELSPLTELSLIRESSLLSHSGPFSPGRLLGAVLTASAGELMEFGQREVQHTPDDQAVVFEGTAGDVKPEKVGGGKADSSLVVSNSADYGQTMQILISKDLNLSSKWKSSLLLDSTCVEVTPTISSKFMAALTLTLEFIGTWSSRSGLTSLFCGLRLRSVESSCVTTRVKSGCLQIKLQLHLANIPLSQRPNAMQSR